MYTVVEGAGNGSSGLIIGYGKKLLEDGAVSVRHEEDKTSDHTV